MSQPRVRELGEAQHDLFHLISLEEVPQKQVYIRDTWETHWGMPWDAVQFEVLLEDDNSCLSFGPGLLWF